MASYRVLTQSLTTDGIHLREDARWTMSQLLQSYEPTHTYWVVRVAEGGEVLAPGRPDRSIQFIDVRDLAEWMKSETSTTSSLKDRRASFRNEQGPVARNYVFPRKVAQCNRI